MSFANFAVKNSLLMNLLTFFVLIVGWISIQNINRETFPEVKYDIAVVTTAYPGAPAEDVEKLVTIPLEKELKSVSGIEKIKSKTDEGLSEIGIYLYPSAKDKDKIFDDIQRAVDQVRTLPDDAEDPVVFELNTREWPIIEVFLSGSADVREQRVYAERLEDVLLDVPGVARINREGWADHEFWVEVNPDLLRDKYVSMQDVMNALASRNITVPAGQMEADGFEYNIRTTAEFTTAREIGEVIIRSNDSGVHLRVKDVANVREAFEEQDWTARINGEDAFAMTVVKREGMDAIKVVENVKQALETFRLSLPDGMKISTANDFSYYVKRRLGVLQSNAIVGFVLVVVILFLFLDPVPAIMTALGIPIALSATFAVMLLMGVTINLVTMLGLIIVLGMLVDDGIIVSENIYRYIEKGMDPVEAAVKGTQEVIGPIIAMVLTTVAAFTPLMFMPDIVGKFVKFIPVVVIVALTASMIESFFGLPAHLADFVKSKTANKPKKGWQLWFEPVKVFYEKFLRFSLNLRYWVLLGFIVMLIFSVWLFKNKMRVVMFPGEGIEYFFVRAEAAHGTSLDKMVELVKPLEGLALALPESQLDSVRTVVGSMETQSNFDPNAKRGTHLSQVTVYLKPFAERKKTAQEIIAEFRPKLEAIKGFEKVYIFTPREGPPTGNPVEVGIKGEDLASMRALAEEYADVLRTVAGVSDISVNYNDGKRQQVVVIDEQKARELQLSVAAVAAAVRQAFRGGVATTVKPVKADEEIDVLVRFEKSVRDNPQAFEKILIPNSKGNLIPLSSVARVEARDGIYQINHLDGKRVIYVTAQVDDKQATSLSANTLLKERFKDAGQRYPDLAVVYGGEFEDQQKTFKNLGTSFALAMFLVFIILVAMFHSLILPLIVMLAIPFGIIGVILAFYLHGKPLSFFAFMGLVGLTGVVVNDSIVMVDFINRLRLEGKSQIESLVEGSLLRLRPILMTTVTTAGGLVSVAYGIGGGDPFLIPMGLSILWGLVFATILTLVGIPCIYAIIDDAYRVVLHRRVKAHASEM